MGLQTINKITTQISERDYSNENSKVLLQLTSKLINYFQDARCYTACFTPHADNINMWREYADGGRGYSIGFKPRAITDMHGRIYKVRYIDDSKHEEIYNLVSDIVKPIEVYGENIFKDMEKELEIGSTLISIINSLKHHTWEYEDEIRLTFASGNEPPPRRVPVSLSLDGTERPWAKPRVRQTSEHEIKFHSLPFGKFSNGKNDPKEAIFEVVIGSKADMTEGDVRRLLLDTGFSGFAIRKSSCEFR
ncbi:MAG: DUF2971 domain-containing protein [Mesorhizobium sp.]|nr:DUF2971 domain-containing protein [Mesorhizobium sp.]